MVMNKYKSLAWTVDSEYFRRLKKYSDGSNFLSNVRYTTCKLNQILNEIHHKSLDFN